MELTQPEIDLLETLGQFAFLPVARKADEIAPFYLEDTRHDAQTYSLALQVLEKKGLIFVDFDKPLKNCSYAAYAPYPVRGSAALTARGQAVLDILQTQGIG